MNQSYSESDSFEIRNSDLHTDLSEFLRRDRLPLVAVLDNLRSAYNVGSIFRSSDSVLLNKLYLCGCTPIPSNPKLIKTALGAENYVPWEYFGSTLDALKALKQEKYFIAALETTDKSYNFFEVKFPENTALIFGNEKDGISREILGYADTVLEFPARGVKNSLNVSNIFTAAVYEVFRQYGKYR